MTSLAAHAFFRRTSPAPGLRIRRACTGTKGPGKREYYEAVRADAFKTGHQVLDVLKAQEAKR